jgi:hypothetical protein
MTMIGQKVRHGGDPAGIGTVVAEHEHHVEVRMPGEDRTRLMLRRVVEENRIVERASFNYRPGDRGT